MDVKNKSFVIIGGGFTGLALGWILKRLGASDIRILEKNKQIGGIGRSFYLNGFTYEWGPHILHAKVPTTINFYKKMGIRKIDYYAKMVFRNNIDSLVDFPFSFGSIFQLPEDVGKKVAEDLYNMGRKNIDHSNIEAYLKSVVGDTLYEEFNYGYTKKFWGKEPKKIPSNGAAGWITFRRTDTRVFEEWQGFPKGDMNTFLEKIAKGQNIIQGEFIKIGRVVNNKVKTIETSIGTLEADHFISTLPPEIVFPRVKFEPEYIGKTCVFLHCNRGPLLPEGVAGLLFPDEEYGFNRLVEYPAINDPNYPHLPNGTLLGLEYPFFKGKTKESLEQTRRDAIKVVEKLWKCKVVDSIVERENCIYPIRSSENLKAFKQSFIKKAQSYKNFSMTGRFGAFAYVNMNNCFEMAMSTISKISKMKIEEIAEKVGIS